MFEYSFICSQRQCYTPPVPPTPNPQLQKPLYNNLKPPRRLTYVCAWVYTKRKICAMHTSDLWMTHFVICCSKIIYLHLCIITLKLYQEEIRFFKNCKSIKLLGKYKIYILIIIFQYMLSRSLMSKMFFSDL